MREIRIALIGTKFMGKAHSYGYRNLPIFFGEQFQPVMKVICGRDEAGAQQAAAQYGWEEWSTDWRQVIERADVDLVDVSTPGDLHAPMSIAAAQARKDVICEKPLANSLPEARQMLNAVRQAGVKHMVAFNFRRIPAVTLAREFVREGKLGKIHMWRATWLSDWSRAEDVPLVWRLQKERAGYGVLGDLGSHMIDWARYVIGEIDTVIGNWQTFRKERSLESDPGRVGQVTVDDAVSFLAQFENGAMGTFEATAYAGGHKDWLTFEINGEKGSLRYNLTEFDRLQLFTTEDPPREQGFKTILVADQSHPYMHWTRNRQFLDNYGALFINQAYELFKALDKDEMPVPNFEDGLRCQAVVEAVAKSIEQGRWIRPAELLSGS